MDKRNFVNQDKDSIRSLLNINDHLIKKIAEQDKKLEELGKKIDEFAEKLKKLDLDDFEKII